MSPPHRTFAIIGLGTFGCAVAVELARLGNGVIGIDRDEQAVNNVADDLTRAVIADVRSEEALAEAGADGVDVAVIAQASDLESSVMGAMNLKALGVPIVWAKATSTTHRDILVKLGVDRVIHPEQEVGLQIAAALHNPLIRDDMALGDVAVVSMTTPERINGRALKDLHIAKQGLRCLGVLREGEFVGSDEAPCTVKTDDILLLFGERAALQKFEEKL